MCVCNVCVYVCVSQPLSEVLISGTPGMWMLTWKLAVNNMLTGKILTVNNDRIQPPVHIDRIIFRRLGFKFCCRASAATFFGVLLSIYFFHFSLLFPVEVRRLVCKCQFDKKAKTHTKSRHA